MSAVVHPALGSQAPVHQAALDRPFQCTKPDCTKSYTRAWLLRKHVKAEHEGIRFPCPHCETVFKYENDLRQHQLRIHQGQRRYVCEANGPDQSDCACGQSFATSSELYRHQRSNKARVRAKRRARQQSAQEVIQLLSSCLQPGPRKDPKQTHASIFEDLSSARDATASIRPRVRSNQRYYSGFAGSPGSQKLRRTSYWAPNGYNQTPLPRQQRISRSLVRSESTSLMELTLYSIQTYVLGSFEAGTWVLDGNDSYYKSSKNLAISSLGSLVDEITSAITILERGDLQVARYQFSRTCRLAKVRLEMEEIPLITDLVKTLVLLYHPGGTRYRKPRQASLDLIIRHFERMAATIYGSAHPLATILRTLQKHLLEEDSGPRLTAVLEKIPLCYEQVLEPYDTLCIWLKLKTMRPRDTGLSEATWELLESCDRVCGFDSYQSWYCLEDMIYWSRISLNSQIVSRLLGTMATRAAKIQNPQLVKSYTTISSYLKMQWCRMQEDWRGAAAVIEHEVIPQELTRYGGSQTFVLGRLRDLEFCLEHVGDWDRLEKIRLWRYSLEKRLFAEEDDDGYGDQYEDGDEDSNASEDEDEHEGDDEDENMGEDEDEDEDEDFDEHD